MSRVGCFFSEGLQDFVPEVGRYDVIWCQWVLSHLTDGESQMTHVSRPVGIVLGLALWLQGT